MTEIKILIKNSSDINFDDPIQSKLFTKEPCEIYINGEKQENVSHFTVDLPLENWGKDKKYKLDDTGWFYTLKKNIKLR